RRRSARDRRCLASRQEGPGWSRALHLDEEPGTRRGLQRGSDGHRPPGRAGDPGMTRAQMRATEREPMRRMPCALMLCVLVLSVAVASCDGPNRGQSTQPSSASGFILQLVASPNVVRGQTAGSGQALGGCSNVQAKVSDLNGNLIDGANGAFTTSLCC